MTAYGVTNLVVRYARTTAVDGVSLGVDPGGIVALVGGDGAGKTSVLRVLAGALRATQGGVITPPPRELGYMAANAGVYGDLTTWENLQFAGRAYGLGGAHLRERIDVLLDLTNLGPARDRVAVHLSGGMRQKLALACALVHQPRLLVLDEPTTGIDPVSRADLWRGIARAAAAGAAVVFASTYIDEAERAGHVVALDAGRVLVEGRPEDIVAAVSGHLTDAMQRPSNALAYRRGARFRVWDPSGEQQPAGEVDLHDAITVAALHARTERGA